jgi:hypothetical protein
MANRPKADAKREQFLAQVAETGGNISEACRLCGLNRRTVYDWKWNDEEFSRQWDEAVKLGLDALEDEAIRRAYQGVDEPVFYKGAVCGQVRKYSDQLLVQLLRGKKPDVYRERMDMNVSGGLKISHEQALDELE